MAGTLPRGSPGPGSPLGTPPLGSCCLCLYQQPPCPWHAEQSVCSDDRCASNILPPLQYAQPCEHPECIVSRLPRHPHVPTPLSSQALLAGTPGSLRDGSHTPKERGEVPLRRARGHIIVASVLRAISCSSRAILIDPVQSSVVY